MKFGLFFEYSPLTVAELTDEHGRLWVYGIGWLTWVIGTAILPFFAWLSQEWYLYGMVVPLLNLTLIPFIWLTPESPRCALKLREIVQ